MLDDKLKGEVKGLLEKTLKDPIELLVFTQKIECMHCKENRELAEELAALSDKITVSVYDFEDDADTVKKYSIEQIPAIAVIGEKDFGIRFYGIPAGYEFTSLMEAMKLVSTGGSQISRETADFLSGLEKDVNLEVFVTPTCPYCPSAVVLAFQFAFLSDKVNAAMVEATEFPHLAMKYNIAGVPRTVINGEEFLDGAAPEKQLLKRIKETLQAV